jgi:membrane-associated phospholipid phosphatase
VPYIFVLQNFTVLLRSQAYWHFRFAAGFSLFLGILISFFLTVYGKSHSFLIINQFHNPSFDVFFKYYTYLGDGMIWLPLLAYVLVYKKDFLFTIIAAFLICTLLTQFCKWVVFADAMRPIAILSQQVHTIAGVEVHSTSSFPSGHTSIAFTYALLMAFLLKRKFWTIFFPLVAFFVGYSRVYLAQHFVTDVLAGVVVGMASAFLALLMYQRFREAKRLKAEKQEQITEAV